MYFSFIIGERKTLINKTTKNKKIKVGQIPQKLDPETME
jgi:hypothetical protein